MQGRDAGRCFRGEKGMGGGVQEEGGSGFAGRLGGKAGVLRREGSAG